MSIIPTNFNEIHDSQAVMDLIKSNKEIQDKLTESTVQIELYIEKFVNTFVFDVDTIDSYLSLSDTKLICKNDKWLSQVWCENMLMSETIIQFKNSNNFKNIPNKFEKQTQNYVPSDISYKNESFFIDTTNKKIYFCNIEKFYITRIKDVVFVNCQDTYIYWSYYIKDYIYPTYHNDETSVKIFQVRIDLTKNQIIKEK